MRNQHPGNSPDGLARAGAMFAVIFGAVWTMFVIRLTAGAPGPVRMIFLMFGIVFVTLSIFQVTRRFGKPTSRSAVSEKTKPSQQNKESHDHWVHEIEEMHEHLPGDEDYGHHCPYCGTPYKGFKLWCKTCGKYLH